MSEWQRIAKNYTVLTSLVGSRGRGLEASSTDIAEGRAKTFSDFDWRSVYLFPVRYDWFATDSQPPNNLSISDDEDHVGYELRYFIRSIVAKGNPELLELLFVRSSDMRNSSQYAVNNLDVMRQVLMDGRHKLVSKKTVHRMLSAAGGISTDAVDDFIKTGNPRILGEKNNLFASAAYKYTDGDEIGATKRFADAIRRLWVAREMLSQENVGFMTQIEWTEHSEVAWQLLGKSPPDCIEEGDGHMPVFIYDTQMRDDIRRIKYGLSSLEQIAELRNELYDDVMSKLDNSKLQDEPSTDWANACLLFAMNLSL